MKNIAKNALGLATLLVLVAQPAAAHRFWIIPSASVLSGDNQWVTIDAAISNNLFFANHNAAPLQAMTVTGPDGEAVEIQNGKEGKVRTTFDIELTKPGSYRIATVREMLAAQWKEGEEVKRWRGAAKDFAAAGLKGKPELKVFENSSRTETVVTSGAPSTGALQPTGKGVELVIGESHPNDLFAGEKSKFVLHLNGKPAANVAVTLVKGDDRYRNEAGETKVTTSADGSFEISWPEAGRYWLNATVEGEGGEIDGVPFSRRSSYTATFEVLPE